MLNTMDRGKVVQLLVGGAILAIVWDIAFGADMSLRTAVLLFALCLVPPVIVLRFWPPPAPPDRGAGRQTRPG